MGGDSNIVFTVFNSTYEPIGDMEEMMEMGVISFHLYGRRLLGEFSLVRLKKGTGKEWLLIRKKEERSLTNPNRD